MQNDCKTVSQAIDSIEDFVGDRLTVGHHNAGQDVEIPMSGFANPPNQPLEGIDESKPVAKPKRRKRPVNSQDGKSRKEAGSR